MTHITKVVFITMCLLTFNSFAEGKYKNGWSEETYRVAIKSCTAAAVNSNMKYLVENGHIKRDASQKEKMEIREKLTVLQSAVCQCAQNQIMDDYHFDDLEKVEKNPEYRKKLMTSCHIKVQESSGQK